MGSNQGYLSKYFLLYQPSENNPFGFGSIIWDVDTIWYEIEIKIIYFVFIVSDFMVYLGP